MTWARVVAAFVTAISVATMTVPAVDADTSPNASAYVAVGPARLVDTRAHDCGCTEREHRISIPVRARDSVPDDAIAVAVTITALPTAADGYLTVYPGGTERPATSTLNTLTDRVVSNSTVVALGDRGSIDVYRHSAGDVIVDITGAFVAADTARAGRFVAIGATRLLDTRDDGNGRPSGRTRIELPDRIPDDATAVVINVTNVDQRRPGYVSATSGDGDHAGTSFLNPDGTGRPTASSVIVPVADHAFSLYSSGDGHLVVDLTGWFTGPNARVSDHGLFVPVRPRRMIDTRQRAGRVHAGGTIEVVSPFDASALLTNLTVTDSDWRGFVTAYPARTERPDVSAINVSSFGQTLANLAVTPVSTSGAAYYSLGGTDLIVDVTGYFTGTPVYPSEDRAPNAYRPPRVAIIGDSALLSVSTYGALTALQGMTVHFDAAKCRLLVKESCYSSTAGFRPTTALQALLDAPGTFDIVYIDVGHNEWFDGAFADEFESIVTVARDKGAKQIIWSAASERADLPVRQTAFASNNRLLEWQASRPRYDDVVVADWNTYSAGQPEWFPDGLHLRPTGALAAADYISRWVAAVMHRPCPQPMETGGNPAAPCPVPDTVGPPADIRSLYP